MAIFDDLTDEEIIKMTAPLEADKPTKILKCVVCGDEVEVPINVKHVKCDLHKGTKNYPEYGQHRPGIPTCSVHLPRMGRG